MTHLCGVAHVYGDHIDTDRIIPGKYTKTLDISHLARHVLEDLDPQFAVTVRAGDVLVAGENFGCGSSREQAPLAIKAVGVSAVIARSFARIFYRNAINIGLLLLEVPNHTIEDGNLICFDIEAGWVRDESTRQEWVIRPLPPLLRAILDAGGLAAYLKAHGDFQLKIG